MTLPSAAENLALDEALLLQAETGHGIASVARFVLWGVDEGGAVSAARGEPLLLADPAVKRRPPALLDRQDRRAALPARLPFAVVDLEVAPGSDQLLDEPTRGTLP